MPESRARPFPHVNAPACEPEPEHETRGELLPSGPSWSTSQRRAEADLRGHSDPAEAFEEAPGGYYDTELAAKLVEHLFAPRNAVDPQAAYRAFRGRDARIEALMRDRGFPVPASARK